MNLKKLFGKYPLIYSAGGKYYAFGFGVCSVVENKTYIDRYERCMKNMTLSESAEDIARYIEYINRMARKIQEASGIEPLLDVCIETFENFGFTEDELREIEQQVNNYEKIFLNGKIRKNLTIPE